MTITNFDQVQWRSLLDDRYVGPPIRYLLLFDTRNPDEVAIIAEVIPDENFSTQTWELDDSPIAIDEHPSDACILYHVKEINKAEFETYAVFGAAPVSKIDARQFNNPWDPGKP